MSVYDRIDDDIKFHAYLFIDVFLNRRFGLSEQENHRCDHQR